MPVILSLDTSGPFCSIALACDEARYVHSQRVDRQHNLHVLSAVEGVCQQAGILPRQMDGVVFVKGPGSFTGVRLAVAVTQALAYGSGARVLGVTTSQALALHALRHGCRRCVTAVRSRGVLWYLAAWAVGEGGEPERVHVDQLVDHEPDWLAGFETLVGAPPPWVQAPLRRIPEDESSALTILEYALRQWDQEGWTDAEGALPVYIEGDHPWQPTSGSGV